jgi:hypothetical protein
MGQGQGAMRHGTARTGGARLSATQRGEKVGGAERLMGGPWLSRSSSSSQPRTTQGELGGARARGGKVLAGGAGCSGTGIRAQSHREHLPARAEGGERGNRHHRPWSSRWDDARASSAARMVVTGEATAMQSG